MHHQWVGVDKRLVVLVCQKKAVAIAVRNSGRRRWSKLAEWRSVGASKRYECIMPLDYSHIRRILARTSTGSRVRLSPEPPSDFSGHEQVLKCSSIGLGIKRVRCE
jgi:hypothetical protein